MRALKIKYLISFCSATAYRQLWHKVVLNPQCTLEFNFKVLRGWHDQCCGSGMIYSGSGSSFVCSEFRIQAKVPDPGYLITSLFGNYLKHTWNWFNLFNLSIICHFLFHSTVLQYTQPRNYREITVLTTCSFMFCWIHADPIRIHNTGHDSWRFSHQWWYRCKYIIFVNLYSLF